MQTAEQLLASPSTSDWLKAALQEALRRDPIDSANDATVLAEVLNARADAKLAVDMARLGIRRLGQDNT
jgi:hypothetical protein